MGKRNPPHKDLRAEVVKRMVAKYGRERVKVGEGTVTATIRPGLYAIEDTAPEILSYKEKMGVKNGQA